MNVDKTELHALRGSGHAGIVSRHGGKISTLDSRGQPRSCYKYLGVFFYTSDFHSKVMDLSTRKSMLFLFGWPRFNSLPLSSSV